MMLFFFFKQKTAYEMRISDWSSDVCSQGVFSFGSVSLDKQRKGTRPEGRNQRSDRKLNDQNRRRSTPAYRFAPAFASSTVNAIMLTMRRTVVDGVRIFTGAAAPSRLGPIDRKSTRLNSSH